MRIVFPEGAEFVQSPAELDPLRKLGTLVLRPGAPKDKADLIDRCRDAEAIFLDYSLMDAEVLRALPALRFVCFLGIGYRAHVDVEEATRRGVAVAYTPDYGATSVAEHVLGLIIALTRHIAPSFQSMQAGRWEPGKFKGTELRGKTLGIVGLGPIGSEMARLGAGIGMKLIGWTRRATPDRARHGLVLVELPRLFEQADVVSVHLSHTPETEGLVSRALLERMKPTACFINTARSKVVDNRALVEILKAGKIVGCALDVHEEEPPRDPYPFRDLPNVLMTPHIGYNTDEAAANLLRIAIATLEAFVRGEQLHVVNPAVRPAGR
jgi:phosphoglycerate dehydrogenase-like enzyme